MGILCVIFISVLSQETSNLLRDKDRFGMKLQAKNYLESEEIYVQEAEP